MKKLNIFFIAISLISSVANAASSNMKIFGKEYGINLDESRIIYPLDSAGVVISVNNPQEYPVLVQSKVLNENKSGAANFVVTPPLFRLDSKQRSSLRITQTGGSYPHDKESLQWLCVKGIPPKDDDLWMKDNENKKSIDSGVGISLQIAIDNCIKLMVRPNELKGDPSQFAGELTWKVEDQKLIAENSTPFYMNLGKVVFGGEEIPPHLIPPKAKWYFELPKGASRNKGVSWQVINDQGGLSRMYSKNVTF